MSQIPEDFMQAFMQMSGLSHKEAEKTLSKSLSEMTNGSIFKAQSPKKRTAGSDHSVEKSRISTFLKPNTTRKIE